MSNVRGLTVREVMEISGYPTIIGDQLRYVKKIEQLLPATIILYQPHKDLIGHFVCIFRNGDGINYFDPYGYFIDEPLRWYHSNQKRYMTTLLLDYKQRTGKEVRYSDQPLQTGGELCGQYCCVRLIYKEVPENTFNKILSKLTPKKRDAFILSIIN